MLPLFTGISYISYRLYLVVIRYRQCVNNPSPCHDSDGRLASGGTKLQTSSGVAKEEKTEAARDDPQAAAAAALGEKEVEPVGQEYIEEIKNEEGAQSIRLRHEVWVGINGGCLVGLENGKCLSGINVYFSGALLGRIVCLLSYFSGY